MSKINHRFLSSINITRGPVLASTSPSRRELLSRLRVSFDTAAPDIDETPLESETPVALVKRLARQKAFAVDENFPDRVIIGSDQIALFDRQILGKPGTRAANIEQLARFSGHQVTFLTAATVCALKGRSQWHHVDTTIVEFRTLRKKEIERYVDAEQAFNCAGGFKCENLGISLFERVISTDRTALIGLPMIFVCQALRHYGISAP